MARNATETLTRKNNKLEAFLKKNLDADTFEKLRTYDACIVCSEKDDKAYKYVVVTDEWIYLTENPPKKIYETVHFSDVTSVDLLNEFPEFLVGEEAENAQHIVIKYLTTERLKKGKRKSSQKDALKGSRSSPALSSTARRPSSARILSARNSIAVEKLSYSAREPINKTQSLHVLSSRSLPDKKAQMGSEAKFGLHLTLPGQKDLNLKTGSPQVSKKERHVRTNSLDPRTLKRALESRPELLNSDFNNSNKSGRQLPSPSHSKGGGRSPRLYDSTKFSFENGLEEGSEDEDYDGDVTLEVPSITVPPLDLKIGLSDGEESSDTDSARTVEEVKSGSLCSGRGKKKKKMESSASAEELTLTSSTLASTGSTTGSDDGGEMKKREASLHLYILHLNSPVLNLTRCAWNNYLIRGTLEEDPRYVFKRDAFAGKPKGTSEKLEQLFCQLRHEVLAPHNSMEDTFELLSEMKSAAERTFAIKKQFWKTPELFTFLVHKLQQYLPRSLACQDLSDEEAKERRADEFEFIILTLETLVVMLRETETLAARLPALKAGKGRMTRELLSMLLCLPEIPKRFMAPATSNNRHVTPRQCYKDGEMSELLEELTNTVSHVLFELLLVTNQANWGSTKDGFFNTCWLVSHLDQMQDFEGFVERMVQSALNLLSPRCTDELTPHQVVLLYTQFHTLHTLIEHGSKVTQLIHARFYEEFKYYIQAPVILQKLPPNFLLTTWTLRLMEDVVSVILQRKVHLRSKLEM